MCMCGGGGRGVNFDGQHLLPPVLQVMLIHGYSQHWDNDLVGYYGWRTFQVAGCVDVVLMTVCPHLTDILFDAHECPIQCMSALAVDLFALAISIMCNSSREAGDLWGSMMVVAGVETLEPRVLQDVMGGGEVGRSTWV